jgi:hypothetical protein
MKAFVFFLPFVLKCFCQVLPGQRVCTCHLPAFVSSSVLLAYQFLKELQFFSALMCPSGCGSSGLRNLVGWPSAESSESALPVRFSLRILKTRCRLQIKRRIDRALILSGKPLLQGSFPTLPTPSYPPPLNNLIRIRFRSSRVPQKGLESPTPVPRAQLFQTP